MTRLRILRRLGREGGYTLIELLMVCVVLGTVVASLTALFVSASSSQIDMNRRFQAQQGARLAVDKMRREIHCSSAISPVGGPSAAISVSLPGQCLTPPGAATVVVYDVVGSGQRFQLRRNSVVLADYVSQQNAFNYSGPLAGSLGKLTVTLPINVEPTKGLKEWKLVSDIVLRNTTR